MKRAAIVFVIIASFLFFIPSPVTLASYKEEVVIVVNNDDGAPGYIEEVGEWYNSNGTADCPGISNIRSRYAIQSLNPGATATFTPDISVADFYQIYYVGPRTGTSSDHALCVVEDPGDIMLIERAGGYRGRYHALMGKISPMKGDGIDDLRVDSLLRRVKEEKFEEVILALNSDVESDATASFLHDALAGVGAKVSRLAFGVPAGSGLMYSDPVTLSRAIQGRTEM